MPSSSSSLFPQPLRRFAPPQLSRAEAGLIALGLLLAALACLGPVLPASAHQHDFADQRTLWGIPCALDVLSNLPFAAAGAWGLLALHRLERGVLDAVSRACAQLFFAGLVFTAAGSALYHVHPQDGGLLWDRLGMVLPFAGLLGLAVTGRVSTRAGKTATVGWLLAGPAAVLWWMHAGNLLPWAVVQLGGLLIVLLLALLPRRAGTLPVHLGAVAALYAVAKLFEAADHAIFDATAQWVSGHSLKHLWAAAAAWPVLAAVQALRHSPASAGTAAVAMSGQNVAHAMGGARRQGQANTQQASQQTQGPRSKTNG